jgi:quinohemoprotein ethanol dehydrogenase
MRFLRLSARASVSAAVLALAGGVAATTAAQPAPPHPADIRLADERQADDWLAYGRTHREQRFSPLTEIDADSVARLRPHWFLDLPDDVGLTATPLVVDGVLYFTGTMNVVRAVDAATGRLLWRHDPEVGREVAGRRKIGWLHSRGLAYSQGRIFSATWDGRLLALDAKTGRVLWSTRTFGLDEALYITGAPKAFKDKVLIGNGGTENGPTRGFVTAYDAATGRQAWRFHIVPGNPAAGFENDAMAMAAKTWTGEWWRHGGGGNAWHGFTYDPEFDALYIGTGNGSPWNRLIRSPGGGDNLFLCSIVALDPDTGAYRWHYQTTPGETWDYNSSMDIVLADLPVAGRTLQAILHAPKNGFFYVLDRATGKLVSAEPFAETTWATHVDPTTGRPVEVPGARYENAPARIAPAPLGAHNWQPMAYHPGTGLVYIPTQHDAVTFSDAGIDRATWRNQPFQLGLGVVTAREPSAPPPTGSLQAWDPLRRKRVWSVPLKTFWNGGTLATAGNLVFQGAADGKLTAYRATDGAVRWTFDAGLGISAPPITYRVGGRQFVALLVGWGGGYAGTTDSGLGWAYGAHTRRLIAFSLEGRAVVPAQPPPVIAVPLTPPDFTVDPAQARAGGMVYLDCVMCHGRSAKAGGMAPDLRASAIPLSFEALADVVRTGSRVARGMPAFPTLTDENLRALMHYLRFEALQSPPAPTRN